MIKRHNVWSGSRNTISEKCISYTIDQQRCIKVHINEADKTDND